MVTRMMLLTTTTLNVNFPWEMYNAKDIRFPMYKFTYLYDLATELECSEKKGNSDRNSSLLTTTKLVLIRRVVGGSNLRRILVSSSRSSG